VFGVSFTEIVMVLVVALVVAGPKRLPELLGTLGKWIAKIRHMTTEVRRQTGIDEILRAEGVSGGIAELRSLVRGDAPHQGYRPAAGRAAPQLAPDAVVDSFGEAVELDRYREFPVEGPDAYGAIPEDLADTLVAPAVAVPAVPPPAVPAPTRAVSPPAAAPSAATAPGETKEPA